MQTSIITIATFAGFIFAPILNKAVRFGYSYKEIRQIARY